MAELRPDLHFFAVDIAGPPKKIPSGCEFRQVDLQIDKLPWPDGSIDTITCMHLIEHLNDLSSLLVEVARVLKPSGRIYFETPHPKTLTLSSSLSEQVPLNFFDDPTHVRVVTVGALAHQVRRAGLNVETTGTSRNRLFAATWPFFVFMPASRKKFTARLHWLG